MSIPNLLAIARLILTPVAMALILVGADSQGTRVVATIVFVVAALTDFADGYLARRWQLTSTLGAFLDTVADKILVAGALLALVEVGTVSTWVAFIIIAREIAIMGLRSVAALDQSTVPPSWWGKSKAALQFTAISFAILRLDIVIGPWRLDQWLMAAAVVVTVVSAGDYFSRFRSVFTTARDEGLVGAPGESGADRRLPRHSVGAGRQSPVFVTGGSGFVGGAVVDHFVGFRRRRSGACSL